MTTPGVCWGSLVVHDTLGNICLPSPVLCQESQGRFAPRVICVRGCYVQSGPFQTCTPRNYVIDSFFCIHVILRDVKRENSLKILGARFSADKRAQKYVALVCQVFNIPSYRTNYWKQTISTSPPLQYQSCSIPS